MRTGFGLGMAALALAFAPVPVRAQNTVESAPPAPAPAPQDVIGPSQLRDFTLNGTVTRRADPQPAAPAPRREPQPRAAADQAPPPQSAASARPAPPRAAPEQASTSVASAALELPPIPGTSTPVDLPTASPAPVSSFSPSVDPAALPATSGAAVGEGWLSLPWLLAMLVAALGAAFYFWRSRSQPAYAGAGFEFSQPEAVPAPTPPPAAPPKSRATPPATRPPSTLGIVSSNLRPWLEIELAPSRCIYGPDGAAVEFELRVLNSGAAPARDVLIEAQLLNSGGSQDEEIGKFFTHPRREGERLTEIPQLKRVAVKGTGGLPLDQLRAYKLEERLLWVPILAINATYRWSGGEGQASASYILGRETRGEKMAAFRLDQGARVFRGLGARLHTTRVH